MNQIIFGHRGVPSLATENSLNSFKKILELNIKAVELDVHLSKDGELVVIHDFNTLKMTGKEYAVSETTYEKLKSLPIGDNEFIPLLSQVFEVLKSNVYYDIEIKSLGKNRIELVKKLLNLIKEKGLENNCMISSFDPFLVREFEKLKSGITTGVIYSNHDDVPFILRGGLGVLLTKCRIIKPYNKQLKGFLFFIFTKVLKKKCYTWTINNDEDFNYAIKRGCLGIYSDYPQNFIL